MTFANRRTGKLYGTGGRGGTRGLSINRLYRWFPFPLILPPLFLYFAVMTFEEIKALVAGSLPDYYDPLATTFFRNKVSQDGALVVFGNDTGANLCVDTTDGCVYAIAVTCKTPKRFVNTTFEKFLQFFKEYRPVADKIY